MPDREFDLRSRVDGFALHGYAWDARGKAAACVAIAHGLAEHALRYERFARALNAGGLAVLALDQRGHGRSPGPDGLGDFGAGGWAGLVADLGLALERARATHPAVPVALFGHSMGSFAAQQFAFTRSRELDALVLSGSTSFEGPPAGFAPNAAFEPARTPYDWLSRDSAEVDRYIADPLCGFESQGGRAPGATIDFTALADPAAPRGVRPDLPVLLVAGDADPLNAKLAGLHALERRWRAAGVRRIDTRYYPGGRHEMLNETNRAQVTADVLGWLRESLGV